MKTKQIIELSEYEHGLRGLGKVIYTYENDTDSQNLTIELPKIDKTVIYTGDEARKTYFLATKDAHKDKITLVKKLAADSLGISPIRLKEKSRKKDVVWGRNMVMWYVNNYMGYSLDESASIFGKNHATAIHGIREFSKEYKYLKGYQVESKKKFISACTDNRLFNRV